MCAVRNYFLRPPHFENPGYAPVLHNCFVTSEAVLPRRVLLFFYNFSAGTLEAITESQITIFFLFFIYIYIFIYLFIIIFFWWGTHSIL